MNLRRRARNAATVSLALLAATAVVAAPAAAAPSTKIFTAGVGMTADSDPAASVVYAVASARQSVSITIANSTASNQDFGSAEVSLPQGWSWQAGPLDISTSPTSAAPAWDGSWFDDAADVLHLVNSGTGQEAAIPPGGYVRATLSFIPSVAGVIRPSFVVKQSNDFSDASSKRGANTFAMDGTAPVIYVGAGLPAKVAFLQQPTDVQVTDSNQDPHPICPPVQVAVEDTAGNVVAWLPPTAVSLAPVGSPGLRYDGSSTLQEQTASGVATFGSCTAGLTAANLGGPYRLTASATVDTTPLTAATSDDFVVYLQLCGTSCTADLALNGTTAHLTATSDNSTNYLIAALSGNDGTLSCGDSTLAQRGEMLRVDLADHVKTIDIGWDKRTTLADPRNGTPFWPVCMRATYPFVTQGSLTDEGNGEYHGVMQLCADLPSPLPSGFSGACVQDLYKNRGAEHAVVYLPDFPGDPYFH